MAYDLRLLMNLLCHKMAITPLVHQAGRCRGDPDFPVREPTFAVENANLRAADHRDIAIFQIGHAVRERCPLLLNCGGPIPFDRGSAKYDRDVGRRRRHLKNVLHHVGKIE